MKRVLLLLLIAGLFVACGKQHPLKVVVDPEFEAGNVEKIAVFPFASAVHSTDDPDRIAPRTLDEMFRTELGERNDYKWVAPNSVVYALQSEDLEDRGDKFIDDWRNHQKVDAEFLSIMAQILQVDAVLIGVVDLWQRDEVDILESATPTTYVGATVTILSANDGRVLFQASDEDFLEGARSEASDRNPVRSGSGQIYSDPRAGSYKAPDPRGVAVKVVKALVQSIPLR
jgi:hypothetical protein